jgi:hypothetical protein
MPSPRITPITMLATRDTIFDTLFLPENFGSQLILHAFAIPLGLYAGRRIKEASDTNMLMPGMLQSPDTFDVQGIGIAILDSEGHVPTKDERWDGVLTFQVNVNQGLSGPMRDFDDAFLLKTIRERNVPLRHRENGKIVYDRPLIELAAAKKEERIVEIHQQEYFGCRLAFTKRDERPTQVVIGISGIRYFPDF